MFNFFIKKRKSLWFYPWWTLCTILNGDIVILNQYLCYLDAKESLKTLSISNLYSTSDHINDRLIYRARRGTVTHLDPIKNELFRANVNSRT